MEAGRQAGREKEQHAAGMGGSVGEREGKGGNTLDVFGIIVHSQDHMSSTDEGIINGTHDLNLYKPSISIICLNSITVYLID